MQRACRRNTRKRTHYMNQCTRYWPTQPCACCWLWMEDCSRSPQLTWIEGHSGRKSQLPFRESAPCPGRGPFTDLPVPLPIDLGRGHRKSPVLTPSCHTLTVSSCVSTIISRKLQLARSASEMFCLVNDCIVASKEGSRIFLLRFLSVPPVSSAVNQTRQQILAADYSHSPLSSSKLSSCGRLSEVTRLLPSVRLVCSPAPWTAFFILALMSLAWDRQQVCLETKPTQTSAETGSGAVDMSLHFSPRVVSVAFAVVRGMWLPGPSSAQACPGMEAGMSDSTSWAGGLAHFRRH